MTAMEKFRNDLKAHKGQEKLVIKPALYENLKQIADLQKKFRNTLKGETYSMIKDPVTGDVRNVNRTAPLSGYFEPFMSDVKAFSLALEGVISSKNGLSSADNPADRTEHVIDGAEFINFMNVATELLFFEVYYLKNLPKEVSIGYFYRINKALGIFPKYIELLRWVYKNSSYDPKYSDWDTYGVDKKINIFDPFTTAQVLDKPVSK